MRRSPIWMLALLGMFGGLCMTPSAQGGAAGLDDQQALRRSLSHLTSRAREWGIRNPVAEFRLRRVSRDNLNQIHVRLDQLHEGVPVFGQQLIVHLKADGSLHSVTGAYRAGIAISTRPVLSTQKARTVAKENFPGPLSKNPEVELVVYPKNGDAVLAYRVVLEDEDTPRRVVAFVNAMTGELVHSYNDLRTLLPSTGLPARGQSRTPTGRSPRLEAVPEALSPANGTGLSLYSGTVSITTDFVDGQYSLRDPTRGSLFTTDMKNRRFGSPKRGIFTDADNVWGDGTNTDRATAGVDAHFGGEMTWDYYLNTHGRTGIFDDGIGALSRVHYRKNYNNAFWNDSCKCMTYGDGDGSTFTPLVSLDVAGHEMTHGVTSSTADLIYDDQSGGLNEAMSDIFGTMVEFYAASQGATKTPNYLIGEDVFTPATPGDALRYMDNPTEDGASIDTFANYTNSLDVHLSSGIANNAYYLLAEGGTHRLGGVVTGIGRSAAERIFYRALTLYMIPSETFSQARAHTIQAATDLFGGGSQAVTSTGQAWSAVGVN